MAGLTGLTIAETYNSLLRTLANGGITTSLQVIEDGAGDNTCLQLSTKQFLVKSATDIDATFDVQNSSGHQLFTVDTVSSPEEVVINEGGLSTIDFRVEGSSRAYALFVDGTNGNVGLGTATPGTIFHIDHASQAVIQLTRTAGHASATVGELQFGSASSPTDTSLANIVANGDGATDSAKLSFGTQPASGSNTTRMTIKSTGNIGMGIITPPNSLSVSPSQLTSTMNASQSSTNVTAASGTPFTDAMIGSQLIFADGTSAGTITSRTSSTIVVVSTNQTDSAQLFVVHYQGIQVKSDGKVGIGTASPGHLFTVASDTLTENQYLANFYSNANDTDDKNLVVIDNDHVDADGVVCLYINQDGADYMIQAVGSGTFLVQADGDCENTDNDYGGISDIRMKENITDCTPKLDDINKLRIVNFNFKDIGDGHKQIGVIADEAKEVFPALVSVSDGRVFERDKDGMTDKLLSGYEDQQSFSYSILVPRVVKAVQELSAKVTALENA